jgi:hypothetical protein
MRDGATARPSVLLIREWERQMSSSGCCGRLEGDFFVTPGAERCFPERRRIMEAMGPLYREIRARWGDAVEVAVVDPRNYISLLPILFRDFRNHGVPARERVRTLLGLPVTGVIVNGRLIARGRVPDISELEPLLGDPPSPWQPWEGGSRDLA